MITQGLEQKVGDTWERRKLMIKIRSVSFAGLVYVYLRLSKKCTELLEHHRPGP